MFLEQSRNIAQSLISGAKKSSKKSVNMYYPYNNRNTDLTWSYHKTMGDS